MKSPHEIMNKKNKVATDFMLQRVNYGDCTDGSVRLVGGANDTLGLVEVCINNGWLVSVLTGLELTMLRCFATS